MGNKISTGPTLLTTPRLAPFEAPADHNIRGAMSGARNMAAASAPTASVRSIDILARRNSDLIVNLAHRIKTAADARAEYFARTTESPEVIAEENAIYLTSVFNTIAKEAVLSHLSVNDRVRFDTFARKYSLLTSRSDIASDFHCADKDMWRVKSLFVIGFFSLYCKDRGISPQKTRKIVNEWFNFVSGVSRSSPYAPRKDGRILLSAYKLIANHHTPEAKNTIQIYSHAIDRLVEFGMQISRVIEDSYAPNSSAGDLENPKAGDRLKEMEFYELLKGPYPITDSRVLDDAVHIPNEIKAAIAYYAGFSAFNTRRRADMHGASNTHPHPDPSAPLGDNPAAPPVVPTRLNWQDLDALFSDARQAPPQAPPTRFMPNDYRA